jgi:hypothetical protein
MGAFNTVIVDWQDAATHERRTLHVQFKYGDVWQHQYKVGDVLKWGGNDIGERGARRVVVDAVLDGPEPGHIPTEFEIYIVNGAIADVRPSSGVFDFEAADETFIVLER